MLDLESRQDILGITVFRDADNAEQFYHLPGPSKISRAAGGPMFDLMTYRKGGTAGQTVLGSGTPALDGDNRTIAGPATSSASNLLLIRPPVAG